MRKEGLRAIQPRKFIPGTTDSKHGQRVCENLLLNQPKPEAPNRIWVSDITYMPLKEGKWAYLCTCRAAGADGPLLAQNCWMGVIGQHARTIG